MKNSALLPVCLILACGFAPAEGAKSPEILTAAEADAFIEAEMTAQAGREADKRARLLETPAVR